MTLTILTILLVLAALFLGWSLARISAQSDRDARRAHQEYLMRYVGGEKPCQVCGRPSAYSLKGVPLHPTCREDVA